MKGLIFALVAVAALAVVPQAEAHHGLGLAARIHLNAQIRQQQRLNAKLAALQAQQLRQHFYAAPVIAAPVYVPQQFSAPVYGGSLQLNGNHCSQFFAPR